MDITIAQEQVGPECRLSLSGEMSIYSVAELKPRLLAYLHDAQLLSLDLTEVSEMDTAGLQLLWLCHQEATKAGRAFVIVGASTAAMEAITLLRLERQLNLQLV
ncbi:STAS domain-containing protein [Photobacterium sp. SDRW27]|uniref:STAS domain-containing protein n=1 Tax=Photobacterium obscurum TaxID=2829490 RepID=UPI002243DAE9|nr:STAS domain-containing protein [Photobacterium obscurum]MCW8327471.1 STAS domain-containing protein [Photobacterium obscurum]